MRVSPLKGGSTSDFEEFDPCSGSDDEHAGDAEDDAKYLKSTTSVATGDGNVLGHSQVDKDKMLPALFPCPFEVFPPVVRFSYGGDGTVVEEIPMKDRRKLKWRYTKTTGNLVKAMLNRIGIKPTTKNGWIGQWGAHMKGPAFRKLLPTQKVNHIPGSFCIGRKDSLWRTISRMQALHGKKAFDMLPECFVSSQPALLFQIVLKQKNECLFLYARAFLPLVSVAAGRLTVLSNTTSLSTLLRDHCW